MDTTYQEILDALKELTPEQLKMSATVFDRGLDEYRPIQTFGLDEANQYDVFEKRHPYFLI